MAMSQVIKAIPPHVRAPKSVADNSWMDNVERYVATTYPKGPYANDAAAAAAQIAIGGFYYDASGFIHIRLV